MNLKKLRGAAILAFLVAGLALSVACAPGETGASEASEAPATAAEPTGLFEGTVVETMDSGGYTYALVERGDERIWVAGPETSVALGDPIRVSLAMPMENFPSRTLDRTFETLYFVASFDEAGADGGAAAGAPAPAGDPHAGLPGFDAPGDPHAGLAKPMEVESIEVPKDGLRIEEIWARRAELAGREVVVRGRVVKFNGDILGRNWLHLQDGTGDAAAGSHDLTVTSDAAAAVNDVVTVRGVVAVDQDFGAGYSYQLMVEEAVLTP